MPRKVRKVSRVNLYHVMLRGTDHRLIFLDDEDCYRFLSTLRRYRRELGFEVYAFCLMNNHIHICLRAEKCALGSIFQHIGPSYVYYFNGKYELSGHLFQDRFRSEAIENELSFLRVLRYICQNPMKAGISPSPLDYYWLGCAGTGIDPTGFGMDSIRGITDVRAEDLRNLVCTPANDNRLDYRDRPYLPDRAALELLTDLTHCANALEITTWPKRKKDLAILTALDHGITARQLSRLTGINRRYISGVRTKNRTMGTEVLVH